jgi:hypothetical protein
MKRSQQYLKIANLSLLLIGITIAIVDISSFVLLIAPEVLNFDHFVGWFRFHPILTDYIFPISIIGIMVTVVGYLVVIIAYAWFTMEKPNMKVGSIGISVVVFVNLILCPCSFAFLLIQPSYSVLQHLTLTNHIYHLDVRTYGSEGNLFLYHLSECDSLDFMCKEVYSDEQYWLEQEVGLIENGSVKLISNPATNTIALQINGETVYTHEVK